MYTQMSLFQTTMPIKPVKDKHPQKANKTLYSICFCWHCNKDVAMVWIEHGIKKRCSVCGTEYEGWKCMPVDNRQTDT